MNRRKEIHDELTDIAPAIAGIENQHSYTVPADYFDNLAELMLMRIKTENAGSAKEEMELISPLLGGLSKKMPFSAPEGYFENLSAAAPSAPAVKSAEPARVVRMFQPRKTFRLAAAAVTVGLIGLAAWFLMMKPADNDQYAMKTDAEVQNELKPRVDQLSDNELATFVDSATVIAPYDNTVTADLKEDDVKLMLADIPDQDLEKYIAQNTVKEKFN